MCEGVKLHPARACEAEDFLFIFERNALGAILTQTCVCAVMQLVARVAIIFLRMLERNGYASEGMFQRVTAV